MEYFVMDDWIENEVIYSSWMSNKDERNPIDNKPGAPDNVQTSQTTDKRGYKKLGDCH